MTEPARVVVPLDQWEKVWEQYRDQLREVLARASDFQREQAERVFLRCQGKLDGTYTGEY